MHTYGASSSPLAASSKGWVNSSPASTESTGWCRTTLGSPGITPFNRSSTLGLVAPVADTLHPSQLIPAIQKACTTLTGPSGALLRWTSGSWTRSGGAATPTEGALTVMTDLL